MRKGMIAVGLAALLVFHLGAVSSLRAHGNEGVVIGVFDKSEDGVVIHVKDQPLASVLHSLEQASGVKFLLEGHLNADRITADVRQPDWASAIRRLLSNYSTLNIGSNPLLKVRVLDRTGDLAIFDATAPAVADPELEKAKAQGLAYRPLKRVKKKIWANEPIPYTQQQLKNIVGEDPHAPISEKLWDDPAYQDLFKKHGVIKKEDLQHLPRAFLVKQEAGKMLRVLQKREYLKQQAEQQAGTQ